MNIYRRIYWKIRAAKTIVIARHVGPDPDALCSQIALRDSILNTFPNKKVYAVGSPASKFRYLGSLDKFDAISEEWFAKSSIEINEVLFFILFCLIG